MAGLMGRWPAAMAASAVVALCCWPLSGLGVAAHAAAGPLARDSQTASVSGGLGSVAATSATNAWAVGGAAGGPLILRWNGANWRRQPAPRPAGGGDLQQVAAVSARKAWAVGYTGASVPEPFVVTWNGVSWKQMAVPAVSGGGDLQAVAATSAANAWAVGETRSGATLIVHWNGAAWTRVASPTPAGSPAALYGVKAVSARNAWAVGGTGNSTLILHWDGTAWARVSSPSSAAQGVLAAMAGTSAADIWAVGYADRSPVTPLILHWDGAVWSRVASPRLAGNSGLDAVAATTANNAWAVGYTTVNNEPETLVLHRKGAAWSRVPSPHPGANSALSGVAAVSAARAWAVGDTGNPKGTTLTQQWNGTRWQTGPVPGPGGAAVAGLPAAIGNARPGHANSPEQSGDVTVSGPVSCAGLYPPPSLNPQNWFASRIRFQTASGDAADATISGISYSVNLSGVPPGGEVAFAYVTCGSSGNAPSWGCQFTLTPNGAQNLYLLTHWLAGNYVPPGC